ncbi:geranylgeranyl diphosphate synthase type I [Halopolyspora algeriensis]|uniref:Geranylgeranyl diphosphate synthase type I n=1 Tax=Halopolyspora algeriensis TaxID=1500506 RepID=A0A368VWF4_9ACTN|nr:polyprenyl synthetase family protein [Halopolyspora algeriensis]RCW46183.1 geranylgeranyl diphosphate synthase type I [Halopolyspora algeriensis]TQM55586.1 geranylgeranyl diphosphate synthase type I [Halopolyspora algeriensis]
MTATVPSALAAAQELVDPELRKILSRLDPDTRRVSEYHFGWVNADGVPDTRSGKALRPALVMLSARSGSDDYGAALPAAAAVELVHNFSLLHDDLMDGDLSRRHRPTAWTVFGRSAALLAGDALLALATDTLLEDPSPQAVDAARSLSSAISRLIAGQAADLDFEQRMDVTLDECRTMVAGKTGALLGCSASIGALFVGAPRQTVEQLDAFGRELGMAFQLVDDLLGLWGDPEITGKPVLSDLRSRKKSLPVVHAMTSGKPEGARLRELYVQSEPLSDDQLDEAAEMVDKAGSREWTQAECERRLISAQRHLELADCGAATEGLSELADYILRRQR